MNTTWRSEDEPVLKRPGPIGIVRALLRSSALVFLILFGVIATLVVRLIEAPIFGQRRPWTGRITVIVCRAALFIIGLRATNRGAPMKGSGIFVANHSSWLDIFVLNARAPMVFVSKDEVAGWPGIGWLARLTGTVFVTRASREASKQKDVLEKRIVSGDRLLLFPEGTSTDGHQVLPFKPTLFASAMSVERLSVQPVTVVYDAPRGEDHRFYGWWGDMEFAPHMLQVLAAPRRGKVLVIWHPPLAVEEFADRKSLAKSAESLVRSAHPCGEA